MLLIGVQSSGNLMALLNGLPRILLISLVVFLASIEEREAVAADANLCATAVIYADSPIQPPRQNTATRLATIDFAHGADMIKRACNEILQRPKRIGCRANFCFD